MSFVCVYVLPLSPVFQLKLVSEAVSKTVQYLDPSLEEFISIMFNYWQAFFPF